MKTQVETKAESAAKGTYWYRFTTEECVMCGRWWTTKERVYGEKPQNPALRHSFKQFCCCCDDY